MIMSDEYTLVWPRRLVIMKYNSCIADQELTTQDEIEENDRVGRAILGGIVSHGLDRRREADRLEGRYSVGVAMMTREMGRVPTGLEYEWDGRQYKARNRLCPSKVMSGLPLTVVSSRSRTVDRP